MLCPVAVAPQARDALAAERDRLRDDAENGGRLNTVANKLQYQVQLRKENLSLREELARLQQVLGERGTSGGRTALAPSTVDNLAL